MVISDRLRLHRNVSRTQRDREGVWIRVRAHISRPRGRARGRRQPERFRARGSTSSSNERSANRNVPSRRLQQHGEINRRDRLNLRLAASVGPDAFRWAGRGRIGQPRGPEGDSQHPNRNARRNGRPFIRRFPRPNNIRNENAMVRARVENPLNVQYRGTRNQFNRHFRRQNLQGVRNVRQNRGLRPRRPFTLTSNTNSNVCESGTHPL